MTKEQAQKLIERIINIARRYPDDIAMRNLRHCAGDLSIFIDNLSDDWIEIKRHGIPEVGNVLGFSKLGAMTVTWNDGHGKLDVYPLSHEDDYFTHWRPLPTPPTNKK